MRLLNIFRKKRKDVNSGYVFDKAKFHLDSVDELGLDENQAFVHTGLFFAWLVNNGLMSNFFISETANQIEKLKARKLLPSELYMNCDGVLLGEMLSNEGFNFALSYFDFDKGSYLADYGRTFNLTEELFFGVQDTWDNYDKLKPVIDKAYEDWRK